MTNHIALFKIFFDCTLCAANIINFIYIVEHFKIRTRKEKVSAALPLLSAAFSLFAAMLAVLTPTIQ